MGTMMMGMISHHMTAGSPICIYHVPILYICENQIEVL